MSCHTFKFNGGHGILCLANGYEFRGFKFEYHRYLGPMPLRKDGEPAQRVRRGFWDAVTEWDKLTKKQKEKTRIYG